VDAQHQTKPRLQYGKEEMKTLAGVGCNKHKPGFETRDSHVRLLRRNHKKYVEECGLPLRY
jgi:hypothetical protein